MTQPLRVAFQRHRWSAAGRRFALQTCMDVIPDKLALYFLPGLIALATPIGCGWSAELPAKIVKDQPSPFAGIHSLRYSVTSTARILTGPNAGKGIYRTVSMVARDDKWKHASYQSNGIEGTEMRMSLCFDGERTLIFKDNQHLTVTSKRVNGDPALCLVDPFHLVYIFFESNVRDEREDVYFIPKLAHFRNPALWRGAHERAIAEGTEDVGGVLCAKTRFVLSRPLLNPGNSALVWLPVGEDTLPQRWEIFTEDPAGGRLGFRYELLKTGMISTARGVFRYPSAARLSKFTSEGGPKPAGITDVLMSDVAINDVEGDEAFFIDPSLARVIFDADANVNIIPPK